MIVQLYQMNILLRVMENGNNNTYFFLSAYIKPSLRLWVGKSIDVLISSTLVHQFNTDVRQSVRSNAISLWNNKMNSLES